MNSLPPELGLNKELSQIPDAVIANKYDKSVSLWPLVLFSGTGEAINTLYSLALLRDVMGLFPQNSVQSCCETILRVMTVSNVVSTTLISVPYTWLQSTLTSVRYCIHLKSIYTDVSRPTLQYTLSQYFTVYTEVSILQYTL